MSPTPPALPVLVLFRGMRLRAHILRTPATSDTPAVYALTEGVIETITYNADHPGTVSIVARLPGGQSVCLPPGTGIEVLVPNQNHPENRCRN